MMGYLTPVVCMSLVNRTFGSVCEAQPASRQKLDMVMSCYVMTGCQRSGIICFCCK